MWTLGIMFTLHVISLSLHPLPPFYPSLISLMVSVAVEHHVYLLTTCTPEDFAGGLMNAKLIERTSSGPLTCVMAALAV